MIYKIKNREIGMTILEVMAVVVIIGILTTSSFFVLKGIGTHLLVSDASMNFKQSVALARQSALEKNKPYLVRCFSDSTPQLWRIIRVDSVGFFTLVSRDTLHRSVKFGKGNDISGSPNGPDGNPIPTDGISFPANALAIQPRAGVPIPGTVYFTDGKETRAVFVSAIGSAVVMQYDGTNWK
ncbi:GspH/FimT family pseudopilin [bacterium]|nr:GspH/FimT family pseudopilin [bacterium]